jgi:hypothetical protein
LIEEVLRYLVDHPDAKDTVDGILEFWLPSGVNRGKREVQEVLDVLVSAKGWLTERKTGSSETFYGLNKNHLAEIRNFLQQSD